MEQRRRKEVKDFKGCIHSSATCGLKEELKGVEERPDPSASKHGQPEGSFKEVYGAAGCHLSAYICWQR